MVLPAMEIEDDGGYERRRASSAGTLFSTQSHGKGLGLVNVLSSVKAPVERYGLIPKKEPAPFVVWIPSHARSSNPLLE